METKKLIQNISRIFPFVRENRIHHKYTLMKSLGWKYTVNVSLHHIYFRIKAFLSYLLGQYFKTTSFLRHSLFLGYCDEYIRYRFLGDIRRYGMFQRGKFLWKAASLKFKLPSCFIFCILPATQEREATLLYRVKHERSRLW